MGIRVHPHLQSSEAARTGYIGKVGCGTGESPNSLQWFIEIWFSEELGLWYTHAIKMVRSDHRPSTCHKDVTLRSQTYQNVVHAYYTVTECINVKICGLKAISALYFLPASLCLDFRLQIRKDSWGSGCPQAVYTQSRSPRDLIDYTWCFCLSTRHVS